MSEDMIVRLRHLALPEVQALRRVLHVLHGLTPRSQARILMSAGDVLCRRHGPRPLPTPPTGLRLTLADDEDAS